jgi:hypothetical protein
MASSDKVAGAEVRAPKKPYAPLRLRRYGHVSELTQSGGTKSADATKTKQKKAGD